MVRVLVSGGGTAGHVYPSLTVAEHLRDEELCDVAYVGVPDGLEARLASEAGLPFYGIAAKGFDRGKPLSIVPAAWTALLSWMRCMRLLRRLRPDVVVGFGGYVSVPMGLAAAFAGLPLVLHEQNAVAGLANRVLSRWAHTVCLTYASSVTGLMHPSRAFVTGDPVRPTVTLADRATGRSALKLSEKDTVVLVFGGSRGARHLNEAMLNLYSRLMAVRGVKVVHVAGPAEIDAVREKLAEAKGKSRSRKWTVYEYIDRMGDAIAAADLVVCRAGATTLAEIASVGRACVVVPFPYATRDHQSLNAQVLAAAGAAVVVPDSGIDEPLFGDEIIRLLQDEAARERMGDAAASLARPMAAHAVSEAVIEAAVERRKRLGVRNPEVASDADEAEEVEVASGADEVEEAEVASGAKEAEDAEDAEERPETVSTASGTEAS